MADDTTEADGNNSNDHSEQSGSGLRTLLLLGFSFIAGYLVGKSQGSESNLREELDDLGRTKEGPMEIEIQSTEGSSVEEGETDTQDVENEESDAAETEDESDDEETKETEDDEAEDEV
ncbi:hypothetical protein [Haladaptatus sp. DFWS20]|uniref:hypothetical protein n=1 Tax=Haladaptatus sp. DFWS20 TaxID=3403467 RepID=UPI003EBEA239